MWTNFFEGVGAVVPRSEEDPLKSRNLPILWNLNGFLLTNKNFTDNKQRLHKYDFFLFFPLEKISTIMYCDGWRRQHSCQRNWGKDRAPPDPFSRQA